MNFPYVSWEYNFKFGMTIPNFSKLCVSELVSWKEILINILYQDTPYLLLNFLEPHVASQISCIRIHLVWRVTSQKKNLEGLVTPLYTFIGEAGMQSN